MGVTLDPLRDLVLVKLRILPERTIIRVSENHSAGWADVIAVGPETMDVKAGDVVLVSVLAGQLVGDELLLPESSVLAFEDCEISPE